jgi:Protein  of unknown function (DUF3018)
MANLTFSDRLHVTIPEIHYGCNLASKAISHEGAATSQRLRAQGLRLIRIWVPDMRAPSFRAEAHRQSLAVATSSHACEDQTFIDSASDWGK